MKAVLNKTAQAKADEEKEALQIAEATDKDGLYEVSDAKAGEGFTIDADKVNGDVLVSAKFEADGTEEYKLRSPNS